MRICFLFRTVDQIHEIRRIARDTGKKMCREAQDDAHFLVPDPFVVDVAECAAIAIKLSSFERQMLFGGAGIA